MANVPTLCEVNYDFDDYGYEEVIPLRGPLSITPRPNITGGVYRYDRGYELSLLSPDKNSPLSKRDVSATTARSSARSFRNERYENYASGHYGSYQDHEPHMVDDSDIHNHGRQFRHRHDVVTTEDGQAHTSLSSKPRPNTALPYFSDWSVSGYGSQRSRSRVDSRLKWVEPLETWVEAETKNPVPYLSFVQNVSLTDRGTKTETEVIERDVIEHAGPCGRFIAHMHMRNVSLAPVRRKVKTVKAKKPQPPQVSDPHKDRPRVRVSYPPWPPKRSKAKKIVLPSTSDTSTNASQQPAPPSPTPPPKSASPQLSHLPPSREPSPEPDEDMGYRSGEQEEEAVDKGLYDDLGPYVSTERVDAAFVKEMRNVTVKEKPPGGGIAKRGRRPRTLPPLESSSKPEVTKSKKRGSEKQKKVTITKKKDDVIVRIPQESAPQMEKEGNDELLEAPQIPTVKLDDAIKEGLTIKRDSEGETKKQKKPRAPIVKKTRVVKAKVVPVEEPPKTDTPQLEQKKKASWIFDDEDFSSEGENEIMEELPEEPKASTPVPKTPTPPPRTPSPKQKEDEDDEAYKKRWGPRIKDTSLEDERERQRIAEERRRKAALLFERLRGKKYKDGEDDQDDDEGINFDEYDFLAKYCIFNNGNLEMYKKTFDVVDEDDDGVLDFEETLMGLKGINRGLSDAEQEYIYRVLEHVGYKVTDGADLKLFSVICALSHKINALDSWMRNLIGRVDFRMLDMKMFMCKTLWECNVDPETNTIPIDQLCVELRAGGVSIQHERQVREKLQHLHALDLLDFLTYVPLFIMIHTSVVDNPLDDTRDK